ncbi:MAG: hypothetical protein O7F11_10050 [Acidobacteria bacterium]|nr:hypothetical protein [Acidobacteriota bacterium]
MTVPHGVYNNFDLSPDGTQLAIQNASGAQDQVYVYDSRRGTFTRLTLDGANIYPVWSRDGREVFFASSRDGEGYRLYRKPVDGSAPASRLLTDEQEALMETDLRHPSAVTPDGKWLAYLTNRAGPYRIMVRPFPEVERREWIVSGNDGFDPRWTPRGDALLYRQGWGRIMRVPMGDGDEFTPGVVRLLLEIDFHDAAGSSFAVSPDGKRVPVNKPVEVSLQAKTPVTLVTGWAEEVSRVVGVE